MPNSKITFNDRDEFNRRGAAHGLINLLTKDAEISPLIIDASWGSGKTEFTYKLINELNSLHPDKFHTIYFDAFKADHVDSPLLSIVAAMTRMLNENQGKDLRVVAAPLMKMILTPANIASRCFIGQSIEDAINDFKKSGNTVMEELILEHEQATERLESFRNTLTEIASEKPIILFIDELDRCRPDYAVSIFELIKHVMEVPNMFFVLVCNLHQMQAAVSHRYGPDIDARQYLDKFIRFSFHLSNIFNAQMGYGHASEQHFINIARKDENGLKFSQRKTHDFIRNLIKRNELSLREVETYYRYLHISQLRMTPDDERAGSEMLAALGVYLFAFRKDLAKDVASEKIDARAIVPLFTDYSLDNLYAFHDAMDRSRKDAFLELAIALRNFSTPYDFKEDRKDYPDILDYTRNLFENSWPDKPNILDILGNVVRRMMLII